MIFLAWISILIVVLTTDYQILINGIKETVLPRNISEKLPTDSMLYNLLRDDQALRTRNLKGQYELTLDHPEIFEIALLSAVEKSFVRNDAYEMLTNAGYGIHDGIDGLAETMEYLGLSPNDHINAMMVLRDSAASYRMRLEKYQPLLELELQNYAAQMINQFAATLKYLEESYSADELIDNPFVAKQRFISFTIPLGTKTVTSTLDLSSSISHNGLCDFAFDFDFEPSEQAKGLFDGLFLKEYWDKQTKVFKIMVKNHIVSHIVLMMERMSNYQYAVDSVYFRRMRSGDIRLCASRTSPGPRFPNYPSADYLVVTIQLSLYDSNK